MCTMATLSYGKSAELDVLHSDRIVPEDHGTGSRDEGPKKRRATDSRISYPRKRAMTACQLSMQDAEDQM